MLADIWPNTDHMTAIAQLQTAVAAINDAATAVTGKPGPVLAGQTSDAFGNLIPTPELYVHIMGEVYVEVR